MGGYIIDYRFLCYKKSLACWTKNGFKNILNEYIPEIKLPHIYPPISLGREITDSIILENKKIHFLLATISDTASDFSEQKGYTASEEFYIEHNIDILRTGNRNNNGPRKANSKI